VATFILAAAIAIFAQNPIGEFKELRATRMTIKGQNGKNLMILAERSNGGWLTFFDGNEKPRIAIGLTGTGPSMYLLDKEGKRRVSIEQADGAEIGSGAGLFLCDPASHTIVRLSVDKGGEPTEYPGTFLIRDEKGNAVIKLTTKKGEDNLLPKAEKR